MLLVIQGTSVLSPASPLLLTTVAAWVRFSPTLRQIFMSYM